jgi:alpha-1,3-glucan synthase
LLQKDPKLIRIFPDPSDVAIVETLQVNMSKVQPNPVSEGLRPEKKRLAQEWAGIAQVPAAELLVFVGRWSKQKGIDLIADLTPTM